MISGYIEVIHKIVIFKPKMKVFERSLNIIQLILEMREGLMKLKNIIILFFIIL